MGIGVLFRFLMAAFHQECSVVERRGAVHLGYKAIEELSKMRMIQTDAGPRSTVLTSRSTSGRIKPSPERRLDSQRNASMQRLKRTPKTPNEQDVATPREIPLGD